MKNINLIDISMSSKSHDKYKQQKLQFLKPMLGRETLIKANNIVYISRYLKLLYLIYSRYSLKNIFLSHLIDLFKISNYVFEIRIEHTPDILLFVPYYFFCKTLTLLN